MTASVDTAVAVTGCTKCALEPASRAIWGEIVVSYRQPVP